MPLSVPIGLSDNTAEPPRNWWISCGHAVIVIGTAIPWTGPEFLSSKVHFGRFGSAGNFRTRRKGPAIDTLQRSESAAGKMA